MMKEQGSLVEMMALWLPHEWSEAGHRLWWSPQLELWALMVQEYQSEVVAVIDGVESDEGQQYAIPTDLVCLPSVEIEHCVQRLVS